MRVKHAKLRRCVVSQVNYEEELIEKQTTIKVNTSIKVNLIKLKSKLISEVQR